MSCPLGQSLEPACPVQVPLEHTLPDAHGAPHSPQWLALLLTLTHSPLHITWPAGQWLPQAPFAHT